MPGAYVPPQLRGRTSATPDVDSPAAPASSTPSPGVWTAEEIDSYYWPPSSKDYVDGKFKYSAGDVGSRTLHDAASSPGRLAYIFLYPQANPRWDTDHIIYTKSCLGLLPELPPEKTDATIEAVAEDRESQDGKPSTTANSIGDNTTSADTETLHNPIAVYKVIKNRGNGGRNIEFEGWFNIERLEYLEPRSNELIRMLEQKWTLTDGHGYEYLEKRESDKWHTSLNLRWAVVKFAKDEAAEKERGEPPIQRAPTKSVQEMLAEMRLKDSADAVANQTGGNMATKSDDAL